jgi:vitamin B12/bleomycin/antimicrobial peptide transport system ATP-binding/permease protein
MTALSNKNAGKFWHYLFVYLLSVGAATPIGVFYRYSEEKFCILWREWLTNKLIKKYFYRRAYYNLRTNKDLDNPDQRITEDVKNFTATTLSFSLIILNSIITLVSFVGVIFVISIRILLSLSVGTEILLFLQQVTIIFLS